MSGHNLASPAPLQEATSPTPDAMQQWCDDQLELALAWQRIEKAVDRLEAAPDKVAEGVELLRESHQEMCARLREVVEEFKLGLGGEKPDTVVITELRRLRAASPLSESPEPASEPHPDRETLWRWCYALNLVAGDLALKLRNAEQREAGEEDNWPAQQEWRELAGSSHSIFLRAVRELAGINDAAFLAIVRGEAGERFVDIAEELYARASRSASTPEPTGRRGERP